MSNLRFSVFECSGEDPIFPSRELNEYGTSNKGYMTSKNCEYPQHFVLKLEAGLCRISQVQILSHQTNIATKIELYICQSQPQEANFQRLGFLTLKSNHESNYMARELKTVHIDVEACFIKLVLHKCYINEQNIFSQVGIMNINLLGEVLNPTHQSIELSSYSTGEAISYNNNNIPSRDVSLQQRSAQKGSLRSNQMSDKNSDIRFDPKTAEKIREIQSAKETAVANEDYDQAKRLKLMEDQLKSIGLQLARLEIQKLEAVAQEDYDNAKRIKEEILILEASVRSNDLRPTSDGQSPVKSMKHDQLASKKRPPSKILPKDIYTDELLATNPMPTQSPAKIGDGATKYTGNPKNVISDGDYQSRREQIYSDANSEEEIYVLNNSSNMFRGIPDAENLPDPEELPSALLRESEDMLNIIGEFFTRCFYSNLWNHRDATIRKTTMSLYEYDADIVQILKVCSTLVQSGAGDRIAQVALSAFRLLDEMLVLGANLGYDEMQQILGSCTTQLINKLGETQGKVREEAGRTLLRLAAAGNVGVSFVTSHLTKRPKKPLALKLLLGRLEVIKQLVEAHELQRSDTSEHSAAGIMSFLEDTNSFAHQSREIRDAAKDLTVQVYKVVGHEVESYLKSLRPKQMEEYQVAFEQIESSKGGAQVQISSKTNASSSNIRVENSQSQFMSNMARDMSEAKKIMHDADGEDDESVDEYTCTFCGIVDTNFNSEMLDQHFWGACKMLTPCKMCGQVIEIASLNEHLLVECELKHNHQECPRCGEAITTKFFQKHTQLNDCLPRPSPNNNNRCPLCHEDIPPGKSGWKEHLLNETCPNNPRT